MITLPPDQGGAGISPGHGEWENVVSIFPLHDEATNKQWIRDWSKKTFLSQEELGQIRDKFGESVSFFIKMSEFLNLPNLFLK